MATLLREASEKLAEASDRLMAAQLLEQERRDKLHAQFREVVQSVGKLSDLLLELVP
jgi:hypothetical protein